MADNTTLNLGTGGDTLRTDDIGGGVKVPASKILLGGDGLDLGFVTGTNPLPTQPMSGSVTGLLVGGVALSNANPVPVTGSITLASVGTITGSVSLSRGVTVSSGSVTGLLVGGVAIAGSNPLPVTGTVHLADVSTVTGSVTLAAAPNVTVLSGSVSGLLVGGVAASLSNPVPVEMAYEPATQILSGSTIRAVYHAFGDPNTSGSANQIIPPAGANNRIAVLAAHLMPAAACNVRWQSTGSAGTITNISGRFYLPASGGYVLPHNPHGWFKTVANEGLNLSIDSNTTVGLILTWTIFNNP